MFKFIFRHTQCSIAVTIIAETQEEAEDSLKIAWNRLADEGWDLPHHSTYEIVEQIIL